MANAVMGNHFIATKIAGGKKMQKIITAIISTIIVIWNEVRNRKEK